MTSESNFDIFLRNLDCKNRYQIAVSVTATFSISVSTMLLFAPIFTDDFYYTAPECSASNMSNHTETINKDTAKVFDISDHLLHFRYHLPSCSEQLISHASLVTLTLGFLLGTSLGTTMSNRGGRRLVMTFNLVNTIAFSPLTLLAPSLASRIVLRLFLGLSLSGGIVSSLLFLSDVLYSQKDIISVPIAVVPGSLMLLTLLAFSLRSYGHLQITLTVIAIAPLIAAIILPESPRWRLLSRDFPDTVLSKALRRISKWNQNTTPPISNSQLSQLRLSERPIKYRIFTLLGQRSPHYKLRIVGLWLTLHLSFLVFTATMLEAGHLPPNPFAALLLLAVGDAGLAALVRLSQKYFSGATVRRWTPVCLIATLLSLGVVCALLAGLYTDDDVCSSSSSSSSNSSHGNNQCTGLQQRWGPLLSICPVHGLAALSGQLGLLLLLAEAHGESSARASFLASGLQAAFIAGPPASLVIPLGSLTMQTAGLAYGLFASLALLAGLTTGVDLLLSTAGGGGYCLPPYSRTLEATAETTFKDEESPFSDGRQLLEVVPDATSNSASSKEFGAAGVVVVADKSCHQPLHALNPDAES